MNPIYDHTSLNSSVSHIIYDYTLWKERPFTKELKYNTKLKNTFSEFFRLYDSHMTKIAGDKYQKIAYKEGETFNYKPEIPCDIGIKINEKVNVYKSGKLIHVGNDSRWCKHGDICDIIVGFNGLFYETAIYATKNYEMLYNIMSIYQINIY